MPYRRSPPARTRYRRRRAGRWRRRLRAPRRRAAQDRACRSRSAQAPARPMRPCHARGACAGRAAEQAVSGCSSPAEREHVTEAARALNLAQSAPSHAVATLEPRHNTRLFDRVGRRVVLTEAGRAFLAEARTILLQVERAELSLSEFGQLER